MTDRDTFAAAALTGLIANEGEGPSLSATCRYAYCIADAMLAVRDSRSAKETNLDAAPAAKAEDEMKEPNGSSTGEPGGEPESTVSTGNTQEPVAWIAVFDGDDADGEFVWPNEGLAREWARARPGVQIAPLYLSPQLTLTDGELEAVAWCAERWHTPQHTRETLRRLLERLGGER